MNTSLISAEHTVTSMETQSADNIYMESGKTQKEEVSYEHAGYQVRVHFNGDKTLMQCIRNLAERGIGW